MVAVLSAGQSARVGGEISAVMQNQTTRPLAVMLIATPLMLAMRRRSTSRAVVPAKAGTQ